MSRRDGRFRECGRRRPAGDVGRGGGDPRRRAGQRGDEPVTSRDGCRPRECDARAGTIDPAVPEPRRGLVLPGPAADASPAGRAGSGVGGRHEWSAGGVDQAGGRPVELLVIRQQARGGCREARAGALRNRSAD
ncbi:hypothetical protein GCM10027186_07760 [Micromonospora schwarzwaldensis]